MAAARAFPGALQCLLLFSTAFQFKFLFAMQIDSRPELKYLESIHKATEFTPEIEYDYIVVGGGTAGCPLAATLSQNYSVLLLERGGGGGYSNPYVLREENMFLGLFQADEEDSPVQAFTSEDGIGLARGRVLGGSSMINFGLYSRADDHFYESSGIEWDMDSVKKAYEWVEESVAHQRDTQNIWQVATRDALIESGIGPDNGNTFDHLVGTKFGGSTFDANGTRHGAVELLNKANPNNLQVVVHATVNRVIFSPNSESSGLSAVGVVYQDSTGKSHQAHISKSGEVILCAGSIGSTQLLLLSGVGPGSYLSSLNISVVHDQNFVGQFMADNPRNNIVIVVPFAVDGTINPVVVGITGNTSYIETIAAPTPFTSPVSPFFFPYPSPPLNISLGYFASKVARVTSTGSLRLNSPTDVKSSPSVRFNYFSKPEDLHQCADGVHTMKRMLNTRALDQFKFHDPSGRKYFKFVGSAIPENTSDSAAMEIFCRNTLTTFYHYHGGCSINKVVDTNFKVTGIGAMRVIDGSTLVHSPGTNPQATLMMLGRYMGLKIHDQRLMSAKDT